MSRQPRILIVDDEAPIRALLGEYLHQAGYEVALAQSGSEAMDLLARHSFDLVMSDVRMPGMNGLELLTEIVGGHPTVGVLMLTACEDLTLAVNAMRIGALDYILKPFRLTEVVQSLEEALKRKQNMLEQEKRLELLEATVNERTIELRKMLEQIGRAHV